MGIRAGSLSRSGIRPLPAMLLCAALTPSAQPQLLQPGECPFVQNIQTFEAKRLTGATLERQEPDLDRYGQFYGEGVLLLRNGHFLRLIHSEVFLWDWIYWDNGQEIVGDISPLHFMEVFARFSVATGKPLETFQVAPSTQTPPAWAAALSARESARGSGPPVPKRDCRFRPYPSSHPERR